MNLVETVESTLRDGTLPATGGSLRPTLGAEEGRKMKVKSKTRKKPSHGQPSPALAFNF